MSTFEVNDMTCGHCAGRIRAVIGTLDPQAKIAIDVDTRRIVVESDRATGAQVQAAIKQAGYTAVQVESAVVPTGPQRRRGCCGG